MRHRRGLRSYLFEVLLTVFAVLVITLVMIDQRGIDPLLLQEALLPTGATDAHETEVQIADGVWRDDFSSMSDWVVWAGASDVTADGALLLRDRPDAGTIVLQKRPLLFEAAEIEMQVSSNGGVFSIGVAESGEGPLTELTGAKDRCLPGDGIALDLDFGSPGGAAGRLRWMRGGNEMLSVVTQQRPLPPGEWADVDLTLGPRRCAVTLNGREAGEIGIPWHEGGYRVYLGARGAASRVDHIALTVPMTPGVAIGGGMPGPSRGNGPTTLTAGLAANPRAIP